MIHYSPRVLYDMKKLLQEEDFQFQWNQNLAISFVENLLNLKSAYYKICAILLMKAILLKFKI